MVIRYPWKILPRLALEIEFCQRKNAQKDLDALLKIISTSESSNLALQKLRCAQLVGACLRGAHSGGAPSEILLREHSIILNTLAELRTWPKIEQCMREYLERLLGHTQFIDRSPMERLVAQAREKLRTPVGMSQSLAQYAANLGVSEGHFSRSFTAIAGRTFREELRKVRIEAACRLLRESELKLSAITAQIGLRDPSQFISDFRTEIGMTPGAYRKQCRRKQ